MAEVKDTALGCLDGAESVVTGAAVAEGFAACSILLVGVGETDVSPALHVIRRALSSGSSLDGRTAEGGVLQAKGLAAPSVGCWGEGVLTRSAKEVEADGCKVDDGL